MTPAAEDASQDPPSRHRLAVAGLTVVPKNLVSRIAGRVTAVRWPRALRPKVMTAFGRTFGVDFSEVRDPLASFASIQDFFVRALTPGARPVDPAEDAFVSPCDGAWGQCGTVEDGTLLQVKGRPYGVAELLAIPDDEAARYEGGTYATFYLSPKDYHRFHTPCAAEIASASAIPGALWPVNRIGVEGVPRLFARNERIVAFFDRVDRPGSARLALVAVGATMVGKVEVTFDDLETNVGGDLARRTYDPPHRFEKGAEWGRFRFGSTLVLVAEPGVVALDAQPVGTPLRLGRRIGSLGA